MSYLGIFRLWRPDFPVFSGVGKGGKGVYLIDIQYVVCDFWGVFSGRNENRDRKF